MIHFLLLLLCKWNGFVLCCEFLDELRLRVVTRLTLIVLLFVFCFNLNLGGKVLLLVRYLTIIVGPRKFEDSFFV
jgi:hypothetical protein